MAVSQTVDEAEDVTTRQWMGFELPESFVIHLLQHKLTETKRRTEEHKRMQEQGASRRHKVDRLGAKNSFTRLSLFIRF